MKILLTLALLSCPLAAVAQDAAMPATEAVPNPFIDGLDGQRIKMLYDGIGNDFLFELQDRDLSDLFNYGLPPSTQAFQDTDIVVVVRDDWPTLQSFWTNQGVPAVAGAIMPYANMGDGAPVSMVTTLEVGGGNSVRIYNFTRVALGEQQSERCMARMVINDTYLGLDNSAFNVFECSRALR